MDNFKSSNDILDNDEKIRQRIMDDGYLYLQNFLPKKKIIEVRKCNKSPVVALSKGHPGYNFDCFDKLYFDAFSLKLTVKRFRDPYTIRCLMTPPLYPEVIITPSIEICQFLFWHPKIFGDEF